VAKCTGVNTLHSTLSVQLLICSVWLSLSEAFDCYIAVVHSKTHTRNVLNSLSQTT